MNDFLSNLLLRSFAQAPGIEPRLPSLFEDVSAGMDAPGRGDPATTPGQAPESSVAVVDQEGPRTCQATPSAVKRPASAATVPKPRSARQIEAVEQAAESPVAGSLSSSGLLPIGEATGPIEVTVQPSASLPRENPAGPAASRSQAEDTGFAGPPIEMAAQRASYSRQPTATEASRHDAAPADSLSLETPAVTDRTRPNLATTVLPETAASPPPMAFHSRGPDPPKSSASPRPHVPHPVDVRTQRAAVMPSERASADTGPPTVRVTIGRVEVHAVTAPTPQTSQSPRPVAPRRDPALSLDDYLKQPKGGYR